MKKSRRIKISFGNPEYRVIPPEAIAEANKRMRKAMRYLKNKKINQ
tara:strand:+ start:153210 stop:153347 length:138 start_codon:yes stop_codon:yes gene_type:complete